MFLKYSHHYYKDSPLKRDTAQALQEPGEFQLFDVARPWDGNNEPGDSVSQVFTSID